MNNTKEDIAKLILNYLHKNPDAGDTLKGISRWWLEYEKIDSAMEEVAEALESLIKEGKVKRQVILGKNPIYVVAKQEL